MGAPKFSDQLRGFRESFDSSDPEQQVQIVRELWVICLERRHHAAAAVPWLRELAVSPDENIIDYATGALGRCGPKGVRALRPLLEHPNQHVRYRAALGLGESGDDSRTTLKALGAMLNSPVARLRFAAAAALDSIAQIVQSPRSLSYLKKPLIAALDDPDRSVTERVARTMTSIGLKPREVVELALSRIDPPAGKPRYELMLTMVELLEKIDARPYLPTLLRILHDSQGPHPDFIDLFGRMGPAAAAAIPDLERFAQGDFALNVGAALLRIDGRRDVLDVIARQLPQDPDRMAGLICKIGPAAAPLAGALARVIDENFDEPDWDLMWALSDALAAIESTEPIAIEALRKVLTHESGIVKGPALRGLQKAGPSARSALPDLRRLLDEWSGESRKLVRETILSIESPTN